jgi:hypothetical protein
MHADPLITERLPLQAERPLSAGGTPVVEWVVDTPDDEAAAIAHDILRQVGGSRWEL